MFDKSGIKERLLDVEAKRLSDARNSYDRFALDSQVDATESRDHDEISRAVGGGELAQGVEGLLHSHNNALQAVAAIDFRPRSTVEQGAAVRISGAWYVIAIATQPFDHLGEDVMGISTQSPMFKAAKGLQTGDRFELNGRTWSVEAVV